MGEDRYGTRGVVQDAGGGVVEVVVDRSTQQYPAVGQRVILLNVPRDPGIVGDPWWGSPRCVLCGGVFHGDERMVSARGWRFWRIWSRRYRHEWCLTQREVDQWPTVGQGSGSGGVTPGDESS